jgi:hypothetical protein
MGDYETHLFSYRFDDHEYTIDIIAKDADEAKARLKALAWAKYDGSLVTRISAAPGAGMLVRALVPLRNVFAWLWR